jgi:hypothetical protein
VRAVKETTVEIEGNYYRTAEVDNILDFTKQNNAVVATLIQCRCIYSRLELSKCCRAETSRYLHNKSISKEETKKHHTETVHSTAQIFLSHVAMLIGNSAEHRWNMKTAASSLLLALY